MSHWKVASCNEWAKKRAKVSLLHTIDTSMSCLQGGECQTGRMYHVSLSHPLTTLTASLWWNSLKGPVRNSPMKAIQLPMNTQGLLQQCQLSSGVIPWVQADYIILYLSIQDRDILLLHNHVLGHWIQVDWAVWTDFWLFSSVQLLTTKFSVHWSVPHQLH